MKTRDIPSLFGGRYSGCRFVYYCFRNAIANLFSRESSTDLSCRLVSPILIAVIAALFCFVIPSWINILEGAEVKEINHRNPHIPDATYSLEIPEARGLPFSPDPFLSLKPAPVPDPFDENILALIAEALRWKGVPYAFGGSSMKGTDCSGFVGAVLEKVLYKNLIFPRSSGGYAAVGTAIAVDDIAPADILLFSRQGAIYHVGIALSRTTFIHSASEGKRTGVIISSLYDGTWIQRLAGVRRIFP